MAGTSTTIPTGNHGSGKIQLSATFVDVVTFTDPTYRVEVVNADGAAEIWFTTGGSTPTVGGQNCQYLPAAICSRLVPTEGGVVKLISSGAPFYVVGRAHRNKSV